MMKFYNVRNNYCKEGKELKILKVNKENQKL